MGRWSTTNVVVVARGATARRKAFKSAVLSLFLTLINPGRREKDEEALIVSKKPMSVYRTVCKVNPKDTVPTPNLDECEKTPDSWTFIQGVWTNTCVVTDTAPAGKSFDYVLVDEAEHLASPLGAEVHALYVTCQEPLRTDKGWQVGSLLLPTSDTTVINASEL